MTSQSTPTRVLVVDDDAMSRELLVALLEIEGYAVESADSGETALILLRLAKPAPDLVLADVQMPGISGVQLARKLRRACGPTTLLLAISGSQPPAQTISLFDDFLMKPFKMQEVAAALRVRSHRSVQISRPTATDSPSIRQSKPIPSAPKVASKRSMSVEIHEPQSAEHSKTEKSQPENIIPLPVLNETIYEQLAGSIPTPQLKEMYALCVNDARKRITGMRTLVANRDSAQFVREAHAIRGGCGMLGATELHRMASELEVSGLHPAHAGQARDVNSLDELSAACDRLERMLISRV